MTRFAVPPSISAPPDRHRTWPVHVLWPQSESDGRVGGLVRVRQIAAIVTLGGTAVQVVVWMLIWFVGGRLDGPWWLWFTVGGTLAVGFFDLLSRIVRPAPPHSVPAATVSAAAAHARSSRPETSATTSSRRPTAQPKTRQNDPRDDRDRDDEWSAW